MRRQSSSVAARYWLARLRPLTRPVFWGSSIALMLVMLFTWQYWMRPEWLSYFGGTSNADAENGLSSEDRAIGADIDTLPLLFSDFGTSSNPASKPPVAKSDSAIPSSDLGNLPKIPIPGASTIAQPSSNVGGSTNLGITFSETVQKFGLSANGLTGNSTSGGQSATLTQPQTIETLLGFPKLGALTDSPVQGVTSVTSANRPSQTPASFTPIVPAAPIEGTTSLGGFGVNAAPTTTPYPNSYTSIVEGTQPFSGVNTPGLVAPSIVPISPVVGQSSLSPQPLNSPSLNTAPSPLVLQQPQIPTNDAPFTAPRPIPGRVLGGGEINTFSNP